MSSIGQKEAVVKAVSLVLGGAFVSGSTNVKSILSETQLAEVREIVFTGIIHGTVVFNKDTSDEKNVRRYVNGMIDNHFRKAKELNGGNKYIAQSSGSGRGTRDAQLTALRKLAKSYTDGSAEKTKVLSAISSREEQLIQERQVKAQAKKTARSVKNIDASVLPSELSNLFS